LLRYAPAPPHTQIQCTHTHTHRAPHNSTNASVSSKAKAAGGGSGGSKLTNAASFNPAAIFAPTMKKEGGGGGGAAASKPRRGVADMGLDSLDALLKTAKQQEKAVAAVSRNAYQGLVERGIASASASAAAEGGGQGAEQQEEEEVGDLEALQALVKGVSRRRTI
jgi:hypothetical protein